MPVPVLISLGTLATKLVSNEVLARQINSIVGEFGDQEFLNAKHSLQDAEISGDPRHELISAVNHLQSAGSSFNMRLNHESSKVFGNRISVQIDCWYKMWLCNAV